MTLQRIQLQKAFTVITTLMIGSDIILDQMRCLFWMRFKIGTSPRQPYEAHQRYCLSPCSADHLS